MNKQEVISKLKTAIPKNKTDDYQRGEAVCRRGGRMIPKFRAWTEEGKVMYYDVYPFKDDTLLLSYDEIAFDEVPASDFILMQSTGLKDKNGKEIYEGDIVKFYDVFQSYTGFVIYMDTYACFAIMDKDGYEYTFEHIEAWYCLLSEFEVIGNIYKNPELLEVEEWNQEH